MKLYFEDKPEINQEEIRQGIRFSVEQDRRNLQDFTYKFKKTASNDNFYEPVDNDDWTTGFWTGELWLDFEHSGDECFKKAALIQIDNFYQRILTKHNVDHHDMGFLYSLSCVAGYKLTGSETGKKAALLAADQLISRYHEKGGFIQAWGSMQDQNNYRLIIDCLLNLPLLYWASDITGDEIYKDIAKKHITTTINNVIREDNSSWHTFYFDPETGEPSHGATHQGYRDGSAWARGQAWGIYGLALSYRYTRNEEYKEIFQNITNFFLGRLPKDMIPYWDLEFTDGSEEPRDSSAAAIAACGMLEMSKYLSEDQSKYYSGIARKIMKSLFDHYAVKDFNTSNGLLLHGVYGKSSPYNDCRSNGVDECNPWGDYFYLEALTRLSRDWELYW